MVCTVCDHEELSHAPLHHGVNTCNECHAGRADHVFVAKAILPRDDAPWTNPSAGWVTVLKCPCGWEAMYILPEECFRYLIGVLGHVRDCHGVKFPEIEHRQI